MPSNVIFSPTLANYEPAFIYTESFIRIPFELSQFNDIVRDNIQSAHISVHLQPSGVNALRYYDEEELKIPFRNRQAEIIVNAPILKLNNKYYVEIYGSEMEGKTFTIKNIYKIQIRLSSVIYTGYKPETDEDGNVIYDENGNQINKKDSDGALIPYPVSDWLFDNAKNFSEWSRVCVTKAIAEPVFTEVLPRIAESTLDTRTLTVEYQYDNAAISEEPLYKYRMSLYKLGKDSKGEYNYHLFEQSDYIFLNQSDQQINVMKYHFKQDLPPLDGEQELTYFYRIDYQTINGYESSILSKKFDIIPDTSSEYDFRITLVTNANAAEKTNFIPHSGHNSFVDLSIMEEEEEDGYITINVFFFNPESDPTPPTGMDGVIRRTSYKTGFREWEDLYFFKFPSKPYDARDLENSMVTFKDFTAESGNIYQYSVQVIKEDDSRDRAHVSFNTARYFEHMYLLGADGRQLKIKFNPKISSYKINVSEGKSDTIGGKYPFITRNAAMRYRTLPIEGLISMEMDDCKYFTTLEDLYCFRNDEEEDRRVKEWVERYGDNYTIERDFRTKVLDFLLDGQPKLFKSPTEGNILVRIMDINSTPNQQLSRKIYSFTGNMHEIGEVNRENLIKYGFLKERKEEANDRV